MAQHPALIHGTGQDHRTGQGRAESEATEIGLIPHQQHHRMTRCHSSLAGPGDELTTCAGLAVIGHHRQGAEENGRLVADANFILAHHTHQPVTLKGAEGQVRTKCGDLPDALGNLGEAARAKGMVEQGLDLGVEAGGLGDQGQSGRTCRRLGH